MPVRSAKKSDTPAKASVSKTRRPKYEYTELGRVSVTSSDTHHIYGVIIDASFPYKSNTDKYVCSLKVIDPSLNGKEYATVVIYAKRFENLPIVHRLGDIIRVHRASLRMYKAHRQFNVSTHYNGSWCLFSTDSKDALGQVTGNAPAAFSGNRSTIEKHGQSILTNLKRWASHHFSSFDGVAQERVIPLKQVRKTTKDFDV
jgi:hypothetical protein